MRSRVYPSVGGVRPSVRLSDPAWAHHSSNLAAAGLMLWTRAAGYIDQLLHDSQQQANAGSATLSAYVGS